MNTSHDDDRSPWSEPDEPPSFLAARSIKRQLLEELTEPSGPTNADLADLLGRWPTDVAKDPDVAGLLFEDFRNRSLRGEPVSRAKYESEHPEHRDSIASLFHRQDLLRSITSVSEPSVPTFALPKVGDELFGYRLRSQLGQGAFARVFLAEQSELAGREVALKTSDLTGSEPQTLAQLQHTNIVPIYSVHEDTAAGIRAVCMPYFGGASLSQILHAVWKRSNRPTSGAEIVEALASVAPTVATGGPPVAPSLGVDRRTAIGEPPVATKFGTLDFPHACAWIIARLADGLQHAHDRGVLHRDIKPGNILLGADGTPMLLDFNLSHDENQSHAQVEATLGGTVAYMAPEHLRALSRRTKEMIALVDERSDLYGLGMVLFEMITGHNPFEQSVSHAPIPILVEAMATERSRSIPSLRQYRDDVPWGLESIVRKCLQPDATQRYQTAGQLAEDLNRFLEDRPLRHAPELSRVEQFQKWKRRHPQLATSSLITFAAALLMTIGWLTLRGTQARLSAAQARVLKTEGAEARERQHRFEQGTLKALCLINTHSDLQDHAEQGRQVCKETLALFDILDDPNWQDRVVWKRLSATEQHKLSEDARELLLLLAGASFNGQPKASESSFNGQPKANVGITTHRERRGDADAFGLPLNEGAFSLLDRASAIRGLAPSAAVWRTRAALLRQLGKTDRAAAADHQADKIPPTTARDFYLLATTHLQSGSPDRYAQAIRELREALQRDPRHYWSWMQKGLCHLEQGEPQLAVADFGVCIGVWPEFAWGYFNRAFTLDQLGQKEAAIADYSAALDRDPELLAAWQNRGMARLELGQHAKALADFDRLLAVSGIRRSGLAAGVSRGDINSESPVASAIPLNVSVHEQPPSRSPRDVVLFALRGQALAGLNRHDEADSAFALALNADDLAVLPAAQQHQLLCSFGFAVSARRPADAEQAFARIPSDDPKSPEALYGRGLLAANANRLERAAELFGQALDRRPNFGEARRFRAILLARLNRFTEALTEINTALQAAPQSGPTLYAAACVTALAAEQAATPTAARQAANESIRLLKQALAHGYGDHAATDEDLKAIRQHPEFERLTQKTP
ncbi:MAG: protein kinase domain-containing protein [Planctomycetaceae bacterium]